MKTDPDYAFDSMFDEAQKKLDRQFKSSINLRDHVKSVFVASSVIGTFFSAINIIKSPVGNANKLYNNYMIWIIALYGVLMISSIIALLPYSFNHGVKATLENYKLAFDKKSKNGISYMLTMKYLEAVNENEKIIVVQNALSTAITILLCAIVILILFATKSLYLV
jgi:hypothetical protein